MWMLFWIWLFGAIFWMIVLHMPIGGERHGSGKWIWLNIAIWPWPTLILLIAAIKYRAMRR